MTSRICCWSFIVSFPSFLPWVSLGQSKNPQKKRGLLCLPTNTGHLPGGLLTDQRGIKKSRGLVPFFLSPFSFFIFFVLVLSSQHNCCCYCAAAPSQKWNKSRSPYISWFVIIFPTQWYDLICIPFLGFLNICNILSTLFPGRLLIQITSYFRLWVTKKPRQVRGSWLFSIQSN